MTKLEILVDIENKPFVHKVIGQKQEGEHVDGTKIYHCYILEVLGNVAIARTIPFYLLDEGLETETAFYQSAEPKPSLA